MKRLLLLIAVVGLVALNNLSAEESFQAPLLDGGKSIPGNNKGTINLVYENLAFKEVADFYKSELGDQSEIKWHKLVDQEKIVIYDWGNRKWHRINITDEGKGTGVLVTIRKDSWTWIIGTLIIRFIGVFIVLIVLMVALFISGKILPMIKEKQEPKKA